MSHDVSDAELVELRTAISRDGGEPHLGDRRLCEQMETKGWLAAAARTGAPKSSGHQEIYEVTPAGEDILDLATSQGR